MKVRILLNFISGGISIYPDRYKSGTVADIFDIDLQYKYNQEKLNQDITKKYGFIEVSGIKYRLVDIKKSDYGVGTIDTFVASYQFSLIYEKYKEPYIDYSKSTSRLLEVTSILVGRQNNITSISENDLKTQYIPTAVKIIKTVDEFIKNYDKENK